MPRAAGCAIELAEFLGSAWDLTVFLYGEIAGGRGPAFFRRGGVTELQRRIDAGELAPDFGPQQIAPGVGAVLVGARRPLIAFNVNLQTEDLEFAREIAAVVRESGGGFPSVRALGFALPSRGIVQVSMNIEDPERVALREVVARVWAEARVRGVEPAESELVGLMPAASASDELGLPDLDDSRLLEPRLLEAGA
jgi:glutamate formiminotransferase